MPTPGPVAYQVHSGSFVVAVISTGLDQVSPSSVLFVIQHVRVLLLVRASICRCVSSPRFLVKGSQMVPLARSMTGHGFPTVFGPSSPMTCNGCQVLP